MRAMMHIHAIVGIGALGGALVGFGFQPPANMEGRELFTSLSCEREVQATCGAGAIESHSNFGSGSLELRVTGNDAGIVPTGRKVVVEFPSSIPAVPEFDAIDVFSEFGGGFPFVEEFPDDYLMTNDDFRGGTAKLDTRALGGELQLEYTYDGTATAPVTCNDGTVAARATVRLDCTGFAF
jgi:hypothetical protein